MMVSGDSTDCGDENVVRCGSEVLVVGLRTYNKPQCSVGDEYIAFCL